MSELFDFVVVGGGSAGCVVAHQLAAGSDGRVLLLECGDAGEAHPETLRADGYKEAFINDALMHERFSVPQSGCGGRRIFLGSGRGMGGSGAINAMVYTRGAREDFDAWGTDWTWDEVAPHFAALEAVLEPTRREATEFTEACIEAAVSVGMRRKEDLNDGDLSGVLGYEWMNFRGEQRRSSFAAFVRERPQDNLVIRTGAVVRKVVFDAARRATGVEYEVGGLVRTASAAREVVLCAGALETPKLLMLSGVGPADTLREHGVEVVAHAPEVGRSLHDHPNVSVFFRAARDIDCLYPQLYGFERVAGRGAGPSDVCLVFYPAKSSLREGMMRMLPAIALPEALHRDGRAKRAMRSVVGSLFGIGAVERFVDHVFGIVVVLGKPSSRGKVELASSDPRDSASIDPAYFNDPQDMATMVAGVERARAIAAAPALRPYHPRELMPGALLGRDTAGIERFVRQNAMTTYHYAGTARMGDDDRSVVDRRLRVRGARGLRVADASIMPIAPVSALNAPSMMIGMRAARFLLEEGGG